MKKGISLIILIITIIISLILLSVVIINISNESVTQRATEVSFKSNAKTYEEQLAMYISNKKMEAISKGERYDESLLTMNGSDVYYNGVKIDDIKTVIPSIKDSDIKNIENQDKGYYIKNGKLLYIGDETQVGWLNNTSILASTPYVYGTNGNTSLNVAKVNAPKVGTGLIPVTFNSNGTPNIVLEDNPNWYAYIDQGAYGTDGKTSNWANVMTKNSEGQITGYFVWIPRYAYKITTAGTSNPSNIDVIFLKGDTDQYEDSNGVMQNLPVGYIVHPVFKNESSNSYANGGWDRELTGIWVSKYEAGFAGGGNTVTAKDTSITFTGEYTNTKNFHDDVNYIVPNTTLIKYPVFLPNSYSYNFISAGDSYALSKQLSASGNPYGITSDSNPHLIKNSEWGAVAYLSQSKYGRNGNQVRVNNCRFSGTPWTIYGVTGLGASTVDAYSTNNTNNADNQFNGQYGKLASTTGNLYGVYDMNGGSYEMTSGYLLNTSGSTSRTDYGGMLVNDGGNSSTKYKSIYAYNSTTDSDSTNYLQSPNTIRKGEAIWETSTSGSGYTSWYGDESYFASSYLCFLIRGGHFNMGPYGGEFDFYGMYGYGEYYISFRSVLTYN
jgi:hypothetical protein